jgi:hypothetical protein
MSDEQACGVQLDLFPEEDRAMAGDLAEELCRLAAEYRAYDDGSRQTDERDLYFARNGAQALAENHTLALARTRVRKLDSDLDGELGRRLDRILTFPGDHRNSGVAHELTDLANRLRRRYEGSGGDWEWHDRAEGRLLAWLANFLPAAEQSRFLSEELGNLGCLPLRQRIDHLLRLAMGTPQLARMMRREGR